MTSDCYYGARIIVTKVDPDYQYQSWMLGMTGRIENREYDNDKLIVRFDTTIPKDYRIYNGIKGFYTYSVLPEQCELYFGGAWSINEVTGVIIQLPEAKL